MKNLIALTLIPFTFATASVNAQQVNTYGVCTQYREVYIPGYTNQSGNYVPGRVATQAFNVPCDPSVATYTPPPPPQPQPQYYRQRVCNPTAGAALGAGLAGALGGGYSRTYSGNWYNNYSRGSSSGGYSNTTKYTGYWQLFGAGLGALMFSC